MTDWSDGMDIGVKLPVFTANTNDPCTQPQTLSPGTRAPPGGWPSFWQLLTLDSSSDSGSPFEFEILIISANDTIHILFLKIDLRGITLPWSNANYDFYFNVSSTKWYRIRLFRNGSVWDLGLNYTTYVPKSFFYILLR